METDASELLLWRSTTGAEPCAVKAASTVLNGGDEETCSNVTRLVPTQLQARLRRSVRLPEADISKQQPEVEAARPQASQRQTMLLESMFWSIAHFGSRHAEDRLEETTMWLSTVGCIITLALGILATPVIAVAQPSAEVPRLG
jgi:hypothetical protein